MTGIETADETAAFIAQSKPTFVPSRSMDVSRISPAPRASAFLAHSTASPFVDPLGVVAARELGGIARGAEPLEVHALDDLSVADVEARDDAFGQHEDSQNASARKFFSMCRPTSPDFSGWNCTPATRPRWTT